MKKAKKEAPKVEEKKEEKDICEDSMYLLADQALSNYTSLSSSTSTNDSALDIMIKSKTDPLKTQQPTQEKDKK